MSLQGRDVLNTLDSTYRQAESKAEEARGYLSSLQSEHSMSARALRDAYDTIVQARHEEPSVDRKALDEVDRWLMQAANQRKSDYEDLVNRLAHAKQEASRRDGEYDHATVRNTRAKDAWRMARSTMREALSSQDGFSKDLARQSDAVRRSQAVDEHLDAITKTAEGFEKQCMSDTLFAYCNARAVGTEQAKGWWLVRGLDRLVARASNYYVNRALLLNAKEDLQNWVKHQGLVSQELQEANALVEKSLDMALKTPEGIKLSSELEASSASLVSATNERDLAHARVAMLMSDKALYDQEQDPVSLEMEKTLLAAVQAASDKVLARAVGETRDTTDDMAAVEVAKMRLRVPELAKKINQANAIAEQAHESATRLRKLVNDFKSQGFDDYYSRFDYGFDASQLATQVMLGKMTVSSALSQCSSAHRDVTPPPPPPPPSYSSSSSSSSSSGGFSSGGSIGGGGGFSTGGRF